jgi:hypothetical protein
MVRKRMLEKVGFGRNLVSDGLFLIFVDLTTVTIQWLTYTLNSYIKPYSLPYMYCQLFMLLLAVLVSGVCWLIQAILFIGFMFCFFKVDYCYCFFYGEMVV